MANNFVQDGEVLDYTNAGTAAVSSGQPVVIGAIVGVAITDIARGKTGAARVEGVFTFAKASGEEVAAGAPMYWAAADGNMTITPTDNVFAGIAAEASGAGVTTVNVKINFGQG